MEAFWALTLWLIAAGVSSDNGAESPWSIDLGRFVDKLQKDHTSHFPNATIAQTSIEEYRRFLYLQQRYPEHWVAASKLVDLVWHEHIIDTRAYMADCDRLFARYLHHTPCFGEGRPFEYQKHMMQAYLETFKEFPRADIWEMSTPQAKLSSDFPTCPEVPPPPGPVPCPAPPPHTFIKLADTQNTAEELCIDAGDKLEDNVTLALCTTLRGPNQRFDQSSQELSIDDDHYALDGGRRGRCVTAAAGVELVGTHLVMNCCGGQQQKFEYNSTTGQIIYETSESRLCVSASAMKAGFNLVIDDCKTDCDEPIPSQKWFHAWQYTAHVSSV